MSINFSCTPIIDQFSDPDYPVLAELYIDGKEYNGTVVFTNDEVLGRFDFGNLTNVISQLGKAHEKMIKTTIENSVFSVLRESRQ